MEAVRGWAAQCHGVDTKSCCTTRIVLGMAAQSGLVEQHRDTIPRRCQSAAWRGFAFDPCACVVLEHLMLRLGGGHRGCRLWTASSEAEFRPRGRPAL
jgi:hypothetical protein